MENYIEFIVRGENINSNETLTSELCLTCKHLFGIHLVVAEFGDPKKGGTIRCPVEGCSCFSTWSVAGEKAKKQLEDNLDIWSVYEIDSDHIPKEEML